MGKPVAQQSAPPEVRDIVEWLRSDRFASWDREQIGQIAVMIESGDPCLDDMTPWDARRRAKRHAEPFTSAAKDEDMIGKEYIGDGCYASFDGYAITLTTEQGMGHATNTIVLEPEVLSNLNAYRARAFSAAPSSGSAKETP